MGVTGLWQIVHPCARPIKIDTLNRKRLAVDASIWIYQFLKAVRDKEGNALRNSHVVGFFRRICKLLFFGIKPVFVFDGGAPILKRQTITGRKKRREGRREDAVRTAGRLLAVQMQRRAEEEERQRKEARQSGHRSRQDEEEPVDDSNLVYVDELQMNAQERRENRRFRKKDAYHLPDLDVSLNAMGAPNDPRIMSLEELEAYARQFDTGEDINVYDFSKIDYDSPFFMSLPASDRYNILNAARLRSRLRMGHSKEQLDSMFPDRMDFSRFQIERVAERNELTQRLMNINDPNGDLEFGINGTGRVAGEKGREYVLVKNDGVEGGWALGVVTNEGKQEQPIELDKPKPLFKPRDESSDDADDFEDVPIEGLNRLPKRRKTSNDQIASSGDVSGRQQRIVPRNGPRVGRRPKRKTGAKESNSLFVEEESSEEDVVDGGDVDSDASLFEDDEEAQLNRAIALSLQNDATDAKNDPSVNSDVESDDMLEVFAQSAVEDAPPIPRGNARMIANVLNQRAHQMAPESHETTSFGVPVPRDDSESADEESMDLQAAMAQSRGKKRKGTTVEVNAPSKQSDSNHKVEDEARAIAKKAGFSGPLPFEKLDLGASLLGRKKMQQLTEGAQGGFIDPATDPKRQPNKAEPLPPWFTGDIEEDIKKQKAMEAEDREQARQFSKMFQFQDRDSRSTLRRADTSGVIDLDSEDDPVQLDSPNRLEAIDLDDEERVSGPADGGVNMDSRKRTATDEYVPVDDQIRMGDVAEAVRVEPPAIRTPTEDMQRSPRARADDGRADIEAPQNATKESEDDDEILDWSESEHEEALISRPDSGTMNVPAEDPVFPPAVDRGPEEQPTTESAPQAGNQAGPSRSPSLEFEDVEMDPESAPAPTEPVVDDPIIPASGAVRQETIPEEDEFDDFSDPEEEELLKALTLEAEEHARFASSLNNKTQAQNVAEYEKELKQLRNQQKKDRRDADEVTHIMIQECQQLLKLFGLPYVTAPMEAEAQCAELVRLGLVDGIVTDDSDCFLFGGTRIYKNMFNQAKFVECYLSSDLEKEFDLSRDKLIRIAQLLGSDYTEGLPGVGPVTALEIISEFPTLADFKAWLTGVQMQQISKEDDQSNPFRKKFRRTAAKIILPTAFPDPRVELAYLEPEVDADPEAFQWGVPDLEALRNFLMATIGWSPERTDEVLVPVIRDMNRRADEGTQSNITAFFDGTVGLGATGSLASSRSTAASARGGEDASLGGEAFAPRKRIQGSKRMGRALGKMAEQAQASRAAKRRPATTAGDDEDENENENEVDEVAGSADRRQRDRGLPDDEEDLLAESESTRPSTKAKKTRASRKKSAK